MKYYHIGGESSFSPKELHTEEVQISIKICTFVLTKINIKNLNQKEINDLLYPPNISLV